MCYFQAVPYEMVHCEEPGGTGTLGTIQHRLLLTATEPLVAHR